ncbi:MAG: hypothetical protein QXT72_04050 [Candidatus Micrarchaeia archaeon]
MDINQFKQFREDLFTEYEKVLFDEIVACCEGGAWRAAYIMIWIAIAESLKEKFKKMAQRDHEIQKFIGEIEKMEKDEKSVDKKILNKSLEAGIINEIELKKLEHILTMRHIYAHPYQTPPSKEEVFAAFKIAIDNVLSKPPYFRIGTLENIIKSMANDPNFIIDEEQNIKNYAIEIRKYLNINDAFLIFKMCCKYLEDILKSHDLFIYHKRLIIFTQTIFSLSEFNDFFNSYFSKHQQEIEKILKNYPNAFILLIYNCNFWSKLPVILQDQLINYLLETKENQILSDSSCIKILYSLYNREELNEFQKRRFLNFLNDNKEIKYEILISGGIPVSFYFKRIILDLKSYDWYKQNPTGVALINLQPGQFKELTDEQLEELGRNILQASEGDAFDVIRLLNKILSNPDWYPIALIKGIFFETLFNERKEFRVKTKFFENIIKCLLQIEKKYIVSIITETYNNLRNSKPKYDKNFIFFKSGINNVVEILNKSMSLSIDKEIQKHLQELVDVIKEKFI